MKRQSSIFAACAGALIFAAGCNKTDTPPVSTAAPHAQSAQDPQSTTAMPSPPPLPAPDVPKRDVSSDPKPGQANDHSSPAFKAGGKEDATK